MQKMCDKSKLAIESGYSTIIIILKLIVQQYFKEIGKIE